MKNLRTEYKDHTIIQKKEGVFTQPPDEADMGALGHAPGLRRKAMKCPTRDYFNST